MEQIQLLDGFMANCVLSVLSEEMCSLLFQVTLKYEATALPLLEWH